MRVYYIQTNDYMTPVRVKLTEEQANGVVKVLKAIAEEDPDSLVNISDEDGEDLYGNWTEWIKTHKD